MPKIKPQAFKNTKFSYCIKYSILEPRAAPPPPPPPPPPPAHDACVKERFEITTNKQILLLFSPISFWKTR
jgi:hypothetical protein